MSLYFQGNATILTTNCCTVSVKRTRRVRITMRVFDISYVSIIPTTGTTNKSLANHTLYNLSHSFCIKLPPSFIKYNPLDNTGVISKGLNNPYRLLLKCLLSKIFVSGRQIRTGQILPHQNPFPVTMHIPTGGFHLYMLSNHVKA